MPKLTDFKITEKWAPHDPEVIQLYSFPTPNGVKVSIMLEETGLPYEPHLVTLSDADVKSPEFLSLNPNNKIPAIIDPNGPNGERIAMMETGAILMYLAEKTGLFLPKDPDKRWETLQWLFFQVAHVGPMFGQFGHFYKFAADKTSDSYGVDRFTSESKRLLGVLNQRLEGQEWIMGDELTIADMAIAPWIKALDFYEGHEALDTASYNNVMQYCERFYARPAVEKGSKVCQPN